MLYVLYGQVCIVSHHLRTHCAERCISTCLLPVFGTSKTASMSRLRLCIKSRSAVLQRKRERESERFASAKRIHQRLCVVSVGVVRFVACFHSYPFSCRLCTCVRVCVCVFVCRLHANIRSVLVNSDSQHRAYGVCSTFVYKFYR